VPLQTTQRNEVLATVRAARLEPANFEWGSALRYRGSQAVLTHTATSSFYDFIFDGGLWKGAWQPTREAPLASETLGTWINVLRAVSGWLDVLRAEIEAPDLWAELQRERSAVMGPALEEPANTPFSSDEREIISTQIRALKEYVADAYELTAHQQRELEARLDYVEAAAGRMGRIDWWNLFAGALINLALAAIVPVHAIQAILVMAAHGLAGLFGNAPPALPP
jgi:hypothetical protein